MTRSRFDQITELRGQNVELGLWQITRLLDRLDHPERDFPAVHVAGTNGKGSVCAMVAAALQHAGHRVGLLTSPHLVHFSERIRVNGLPIREAAAAPILERLERADSETAAMAADLRPYGGSFFEVTTALALEHFRREGVDVAVLEVGLGGRLDATNVCHPAVSAITSIDLDHVEILGGDRAAIAAEKAGIVKPGVPVVTGPLTDDAAEVIAGIAARRGAPRHDASREVRTRLLSSTWEGMDLAIGLPGRPDCIARVPLPGRHQMHNAAVAAWTATLFDPRAESSELLFAGLEHTFWPGRLSRVEGTPVRVYDVAHNTAATAALVGALDELGVPDGSVLLLGVLQDKDLSGMAPLLARKFSRAVTCTPPHPVRARAASETAAALEGVGMEVCAVDDVAAACEEAARRLDGGWIFVTGSLFTVGAAMVVFGDSADQPRATVAAHAPSPSARR